MPLVSTAPTVMTEGSLAGERMPPVLHRPVVGATAVAGRRHDDEAAADRLLHREIQRIGPVRLDDRVADREVDDADAIQAAVLEDPFDRRDHVAGPADARVVQHLERHDIRTGRDAGVLPARRPAVPGHHPRDVRPVAVAVVNALAGEVQARRDARLQIGMERNARVDDGHAHAAARESSRVAIGAPHLVRAHRRRDRVPGAANVEVERHALDAGLRGELVDFVRIDFDSRNLLGHLPADPAAMMGGLDAGIMPRARRDDEREAPAHGCLFAQRRRDSSLRRDGGRRQQQSNQKERSGVRTPPGV